MGVNIASTPSFHTCHPFFADIETAPPTLSIIIDDARKLFRDFGISASSLVELGAFAQHADPSFAITCHRVFNCQIQVSRLLIIIV